MFFLGPEVPTPENQIDEIRDPAVRQYRVFQLLIKIDHIGVASSFMILPQVPFIPEVRDYPLDRAFNCTFRALISRVSIN
jgi:hypothetical protein